MAIGADHGEAATRKVLQRSDGGLQTLACKARAQEDQVERLPLPRARPEPVQVHTVAHKLNVCRGRAIALGEVMGGHLAVRHHHPGGGHCLLVQPGLERIGEGPATLPHPGPVAPAARTEHAAYRATDLVQDGTILGHRHPSGSGSKSRHAPDSSPTTGIQAPDARTLRLVIRGRTPDVDSMPLREQPPHEAGGKALGPALCGETPQYERELQDRRSCCAR
jgi:hypothetical protein